MFGLAHAAEVAVVAALAAAPAPDGPLPAAPRELAAAYAAASDELDGAIARWRSDGDPARGAAPDEVQRPAWQEQRIQRRLVSRPRLLRAVLAALPARLRPEVRDEVLAQRLLASIHSVRRGPVPRTRVGAPEPADVLRRHYREAWRRFGVGPPLLAAVNHVESLFGRLRNASVSGAQGPMQFIPATWAAYGLGGDVRDPRDAILGAANYLHANGAPADEARALVRYNPSLAYVRAVRRYARRIRSDPNAFYALYARQVIYRGRLRTRPPP